MHIQSMSPTSVKTRDRLLAEPQKNNATGSIDKNEGLMLQGKKIPESLPPKPQFLIKPEMAGISVTIVDPRSMIPS